MFIDIEAYDHKLNKVLFKAKADFGPDYLNIESGDINNSISLSEIYDFLNNRALRMAPKDYKDDEIALKKLDLLYNKHLFGRMIESYILLAMLDNFSVPDDDIKIYPINDTIVNMINWSVKYGTTYIWRKRNNGV